MNNILLLTYWSFKEGLIQSYTLPYLKLISKNLSPEEKIYLVTFERAPLQLSVEEVEEAKKMLRANQIEWIPKSYHRPGIKGYFYLAKFVLTLWFKIFLLKIDTIHAFCTPPGGLGYLLSVLSGRKLILDSFEPHAESMVENGTWIEGSSKFKILNWFENRQVRKAQTIIGTTPGVHEYSKNTYNYEIQKENFHVKPACVDLQQFQIMPEKTRLIKRKELGLDGKIVAVYAGKLGGIYHEIETFELLKVAYDYWEGNFAFLMLTNTPRTEIDNLAKKVGLNPETIISKFVAHQEVADYLSVGDFGITPVKSVPTKRYCTPIKDGEYWALGLPVIITPNISDDSEIIEKYDIGAIIISLDKKGYLEAIKKINYLLKQNKSELQQKIRNLAIKYRSFEIAEKIYEKIYINE